LAKTVSDDCNTVKPRLYTGICGSAKLPQKNEGKILDLSRAYLEAINIFKTEPEYTLRALAQFSRCQEL